MNNPTPEQLAEWHQGPTHTMGDMLREAQTEITRLKQEVEDSKREVKKWKEDRDYFAKLFGSGDIHEAIDKYENLQADVERLKLERQYASDAKELSWKEKHELEARLQKEIEKGNDLSKAWMESQSQLNEARRVIELARQEFLLLVYSCRRNINPGADKLYNHFCWMEKQCSEVLTNLPNDALKRAELDRAVLEAADKYAKWFGAPDTPSAIPLVPANNLVKAVIARREGLK